MRWCGGECYATYRAGDGITLALAYCFQGALHQGDAQRFLCLCSVMLNTSTCNSCGKAGGRLRGEATVPTAAKYIRYDYFDV